MTGNSRPETGLLELIFSKTTLNYISDLHTQAARHAVLAAVADIEGEKFSPEAWQEVGTYILGLPQKRCANAGEARKQFISALKGLAENE